MVKENLFIPMEKFIEGAGEMMKNTVKENRQGTMVIFAEEAGEIMKCTEK